MPAAEARACHLCGSAFRPRREHSRFCSATCRITWSQGHGTRPGTGTSALAWALAGMREAAAWLGSSIPSDREEGLAAITEAVWWVTIVDAAMIRYHPAAYDQALGAMGTAGRDQAEAALAGLRHVRNQISSSPGPAGIVQPRHAGPRFAAAATWTWRALPPPPPELAWEVTRHRAYQAHLAGQPAGKAIGDAAAFLTRIPRPARAGALPPR